MKLYKQNIKGRTDLPLAQSFNYVVVDLNQFGKAIGYFFDEEDADLFIDSVRQVSYYAQLMQKIRDLASLNVG